MKFKIILILSIFIILTSSFVSAVNTNNLVSYYSFDNDVGNVVVDDYSNNNGTNNGADSVSGASCILGSCYDFIPTNNDYINISEIVGELTVQNTGSIAMWINSDVASLSVVPFSTSDNLGSNRFVFQLDASTNKWRNAIYDGTDDSIYSNVNQVNLNWYFIVLVKNSTSRYMYVNGVKQTETGTLWFSDLATQIEAGLGRYEPSDAAYWNGFIDEVSFWNSSLTYTDISELYNNGSAFNPLDGIQSNFSIIAKSFWDNGSISNFSVNIDGVDYNTTTGSITTHILDNSTELYNVTLTSSDWFNKTYEAYNVSSNLEASLIQSEISFACYEKVSGNILTCNNGTIYPDADTYNFTISVDDYYNVTQEETVNALDNKTINFNNFYSSNLTFITNFVTGPGAGTCNYTIQGITYPGFSETVNANSTGIINGSYNVTVDCDNYAYSTESIIINESEESLTFNLYTANSIDITIYDETSGALINGTNITVTKTLGAVQTQNITSTGNISYQYLTAGNYTFSFEGDNYPKRSYSVQIGNKTYQTLQVYLLQNGTDAVIFTFLEYQSNEVIEDTTLQISTVINGSDTLIAVLTSDITGKTQFYFDTTSKYCFVASKTNYQTKSFCLDPIIFNTYTIRLETSVELSTGNAFEEVLVDYTPKSYWNNQNNTITFTFANPEGALTSYGFNATYNGSTVSASGSNAYGEVITTDLEILGAEYGDKVIVHYYYKKSGDDDYKTQKLIYEILGYDSASDSIQDNPPGDYGLGIFVSTLVSVIIVLLVSGLASFFGGVVAGGSMALLMFAWLMKIGFLNFWAGIISIIILFVVVSWRSNQ